MRVPPAKWLAIYATPGGFAVTAAHPIIFWHNGRWFYKEDCKFLTKILFLQSWRNDRMKNVGLIGLGNVGMYYVKKLLEAGYPLTVFDIDPQKRDDAVQRGATSADTAAKVTQSSDFIILSLPKSEVVESVMEGAHGVLSVLKAGQVVIDTSTSRPQTAVRLEKLCEAKGAGFIDSPLTWRGPGKTHILMVGGKEESFQKAEAVLKCLSYKYRLVGPAGSGQILKLINQMVSTNQIAVHAEAVELTKKYGIDPQLLKEFLMFDIPEGLLTEDYCGCGELGFQYKDLGYLLEIAHDSCVNIPISSLVHEILKTSKVYAEPSWNAYGIQTYFQRLNNDKLELG
jgi:2-hydroxy-3-oxopropionate reductase